MPRNYFKLPQFALNLPAFSALMASGCCAFTYTFASAAPASAGEPARAASAASRPQEPASTALTRCAAELTAADKARATAAQAAGQTDLAAKYAQQQALAIQALCPDSESHKTAASDIEDTAVFTNHETDSATTRVKSKAERVLEIEIISLAVKIKNGNGSSADYARINEAYVELRTLRK